MAAEVMTTRIAQPETSIPFSPKPTRSNDGVPTSSQVLETGQAHSIHDHFGLHSPWEAYYKSIDEEANGRFECEMNDLVVFGEIPEQIDGTWYRLFPDPVAPPPGDYPFVDGDGMVNAFRFHKGRVSMKLKYVETERYLLDRQAGKQLFGRYRNPYDNHPCFRAANDTTSNTNIVQWAGYLLAISERGLPSGIDPDTLETVCHDPFGGQVSARTFSAHPKVDPFTNELICWSYAAKGLGTRDVVTYSLDANGRASNAFWFQQDKPGWPHDAWITKNWIVLSNMPFKVNSEEEMKKPNADHWQFVPGQPQEFLVAPRLPDGPQPKGWARGEFRKFTTEHGLIIHTGNAWEEEDGTLRLECPFMTLNIFFFWDPPGHKPTQPKCDWVRFTIDPSAPDGSKVVSPEIILPGLADFPALDERFTTTRTKMVFLTSIIVTSSGQQFFNKIIKLNTGTKETSAFQAAEGGTFYEPVFVPRADDAPEGDGYLLFYSKRPTSPKGELMVVDTNDMTRPVAVVQLPFATKNQVHGNWVPNPKPGTFTPLVKQPRVIQPTTRFGPLSRPL